MMITRRAGYAAAVAIASVPLILAAPAVAERCGPASNLLPGLICPAGPGKPTVTSTPSPTPSPLPSNPSPAGTGIVQPPDASVGVVPAGPVGSTGAGASDGIQPDVVPAQTAAPDPAATPAPSSPIHAAQQPPESSNGEALASRTPEDPESNEIVGACLLALGGLLMAFWAAMRLRGSC